MQWSIYILINLFKVFAVLSGDRQVTLCNEQVCSPIHPTLIFWLSSENVCVNLSLSLLSGKIKVS
jgi:hypothetical protein